MFRVCILVALWFVYVVSGAIAGVSGVLVLDRSEVNICGPVSGYIDLSVDDDLVLEHSFLYYFGFINDNVVIKIEGPQSKTVCLDSEFFHWKVDFYEGEAKEFVWDQAVRIRIPIFLMKVGGDFLFDVPGDYNIQYIFNNLPGLPVIHGHVHIVDQPEKIVKEWVSHFSFGFSYFIALDQIAPVWAVDDFSPYFMAYSVVRAYNTGGVLLKELYYSGENGKGYDLGSNLISEYIQSGDKWSKRCGCNTDFWIKILTRQKNYQEKRALRSAYSPDQNGILLVIP